MAQTDRELLELAAKAAGLKRAEYWCAPEKPPFPFAECITHYIDDEPCFQAWNPLNDDGDALRLAVKLGIMDEGKWKAPVTGEMFDKCNGDWYVAVRRSIVMTAAKMAENA